MSQSPRSCFYLFVSGTTNYLCDIDLRDVALAENYAAAKSIMDENNLAFPVSVEDAMNLYVYLVSVIEARLDVHV